MPLHYRLMSAPPLELPAWGLPAALLIGQAILAFAIIELLRTRVFSVLHRIQSSELVLDLWGPLTLLFPMLFFAGRVQSDVRGAGWMTAGGPVMCAMFGVGAAMVVGTRAAPSHATRGIVAKWLAWICGGAGVLLLLVSAAHDLTLWVAQCAFAIGAVVMWMNTPELRSEGHRNAIRDEPQHRIEASAGTASTIALLCAIAQGVITIRIGDSYAKISAGLLVAQSAIVIAWAARTSGAASALRLGGWSAAYGVLLGMGTLSILEMVPQAMRILSTGTASRVSKLAHGYGAFAPEAIILIVCAAAIAVCPFIETSFERTRRRWIVGVAILACAAGLAAYRISQI